MWFGAALYAIVKIVIGIIKAIRYKYLPYSFQSVKYMWHLVFLFLWYLSATFPSFIPRPEFEKTFAAQVLLLSIVLSNYRDRLSVVSSV